MEALIDVILNLLIGLITIGTSLLILYLKKKIAVENLKKIKEELSMKRELALLSIKYIEQVYTKKSSDDKLYEAVQWLIKSANRVKIKIESEEAYGLIESGLREMKDKYGETWANQKK